jgi:hypothetical protein
MQKNSTTSQSETYSQTASSAAPSQNVETKRKKAHGRGRGASESNIASSQLKRQNSTGGSRKSASVVFYEEKITAANAHTLLNFREDLPDVSTRRPRQTTRQQPFVPFDKKRHLQAAFQFLVSFADVKTFKTSDHLVRWKCVELVFYLLDKPRLCPICLDPPVAAQITECGHVFCWPCILHYLCVDSINENRRCPLCFETIDRDSLRSFVAIIVPKVQVCMDLEMVLVQRNVDSLVLSLPSALNLSDRPLDPILFNRVTVVGDSLDMILDQEARELYACIANEELEPLDTSFVQMALDALELRRRTWQYNLAGKKPAPLETQAVKNFLKRQYFQQSFQLSHSLSPPSSACSRVEKTVEVAPKSVPDIASICPQENSPSELWPALPRKLVIQPAVASSVSSVGSHVEVGTIQEMSSFPGDALTSTVREVDSREDCMPTRNVGELGKEAIPEKKQPEMLQFFQSRDGQQVYFFILFCVSCHAFPRVMVSVGIPAPTQCQMSNRRVRN